jgi:hypothetical protein
MGCATVVVAFDLAVQDDRGRGANNSLVIFSSSGKAGWKL